MVIWSKGDVNDLRVSFPIQYLWYSSTNVNKNIRQNSGKKIDTKISENARILNRYKCKRNEFSFKTRFPFQHSTDFINMHIH